MDRGIIQFIVGNTFNKSSLLSPVWPRPHSCRNRYPCDWLLKLRISFVIQVPSKNKMASHEFLPNLSQNKIPFGGWLLTLAEIETHVIGYSNSGYRLLFGFREKTKWLSPSFCPICHNCLGLAMHLCGIY